MHNAAARSAPPVPIAALPRLARRIAPVLAASCAMLAACSGSDDSAAALGSQMWGSFTVTVESRPAPPRPGSNEIVVLIAGERHRPIYDAVVFVRTDASAPWTQAIEDGHVGVYRRAVRFGTGADAELQVLLRRDGQEQILAFPVKLALQP